MRICHGLLGDAIYVEDQELQWRKPLDIVRQLAKDRWAADSEDIIVLASGGAVVGPSCSSEGFGDDRDIFVFLRSALDLQADAADAAASATATVAEVCGQAVAEEEALAAAVAGDTLRFAELRQSPSGDPAFAALRQNIEEARSHLAVVRPVVSMAAQLEARLDVQRLAVQVVLDNLAAHRTTCSRSMSLFLQKHERVRERFDQNLSKVEASIEALRNVSLHPALRTAGRESLADAIPRERILRFTQDLQVERERLAKRMDRLKKQDTQTQALCDQVAGKVQQLLQDDAVKASASAVRSQHDRAVNELLPALEVQLPLEGADAAAVLEEERRTAGVLQGLSELCEEIRVQLRELSGSWARQRVSFLQRLREVACIQSKVRGVERQAALLEEEINVQHGHSQQLTHLQKMPRAYMKAESEIERRHQFKALLLGEGERARNTFARLVEEENARRRGFIHRYGCHLPADLVQGLGTLVPPVTMEVPEFDTQLPDLGEVAGAGTTDVAASSSSRPIGGAAGTVDGGAGMTSSGSPGRATSSRRRDEFPAYGHSSFRSACAPDVDGQSLPEGGTEDGLSAEASRMAELEAQNHELQAELSRLRKELGRAHGFSRRAFDDDSPSYEESLDPSTPFLDRP